MALILSILLSVQSKVSLKYASIIGMKRLGMAWEGLQACLEGQWGLGIEEKGDGYRGLRYPPEGPSISWFHLWFRASSCC